MYIHTQQPAKPCRHTACQCELCDTVTRWPEMPAITPVRDRANTWTVDCHWVSPLYDNCGVMMHRGFMTDGASIPRIAWRVIGHPMCTDILPFALGHDGLYAAELLTRKECDEWFLQTMAANGICWAKRNAMWSAVRTFGGYVWSKHTTASIEASRKMCNLVFGNLGTDAPKTI